MYREVEQHLILNPLDWINTFHTSHAHQKVVRYTSIISTAMIVALIALGTLAAPRIVKETKQIVAQLQPPTSTPIPPSPTPTIDPISGMTSGQKIGQLFIIRVSGSEVDEMTKKQLSQIQPGGIILMRDNLTDEKTTKKLVDELQSTSQIGLLVSVDQEGGSVLRIPWDENKSLGGDHTQALTRVGVNTNLAPVLDLKVPGGYIAERAYATDAASITRTATDMITIQSTKKIMSVGKHFPGIGRVTDDPHSRIALVTASRQELEEDVAPFHNLLNQLDMIMSSHVRYSSLDSVNPATFSYAIMTNLLRDQMHYTGVTITDDMNMDSIVAQRDKYIRALQAGHDMILTLEPSIQVQMAFDEVASATRSGRLTMNQIDEKASRILTMKRRFGLMK